MVALRLTLTCILSIVCTIQADAAGGPGAGQKPNRLANAPSPYLRQHALNPVDWHMWGPEAIRKAKKENKPIFLSVGYAACYWCHVMSRESFDDAEVAKLLNEYTIPIKVDRERHPDIDATYMRATELISRQRGWPNSVVLTPDLKPFDGFGYLARNRFKKRLERTAVNWRERRAEIIADAERIANTIKRLAQQQMRAVEITPDVLRRASRRILANFDVFNGGLGTAPKFPQENVLLFLLHLAERDNDKASLDAALLTIDNMIRGGIHDHVGGGFHRYAVDNEWALPHFEKMLYNQALMVRVLLKAYQLTGRQRYSTTAQETLEFVFRNMRLAGGALASALDAETNGKDGDYYLWGLTEISDVLGADADFASRVFGITANGNYEGRNTLRIGAPIPDIRHALQMSPSAFCTSIDRVLRKLRGVRSGRKPLLRDDKALTGWNALMVSALVEASAVLEEARYARAAVEIQTFILDRLGGRRGELKRSYFAGRASLEATQRDYALTALSALALFDHSQEKRWLHHAERLARKMDKRFSDSKVGGLFLTHSETGFARIKDTVDKTWPSGNAAALELFARLSNRSLDVFWRRRVQDQLAGLSGLAVADPASHSAILLAADIAMRGETGSRQSAAHGAVRLRVTRKSNNANASIRLQLAPGWHINSAQPSQDFLVPTRVEGAGVAADEIIYPKPVKRELGIFGETLSLYEGQTEIVVPLPAKSFAANAHRLKLHIQACSNRICLEPKIVRALVPAAKKRLTCPKQANFWRL